MVFGEQAVDVEAAFADLQRAAPRRVILKASGVVDDTVARPSVIAGQRARSAVDNRHQLVDVGIEQHAALLELDARVVEQRVEAHS